MILDVAVVKRYLQKLVNKAILIFKSSAENVRQLIVNLLNTHLRLRAFYLSTHECQNLNMAAYYNEIDPFCVEWLRNLIKAKLIADGDVDNRSITEVQADEIKHYTQCHFFAGIGIWSYALKQAGWSDNTSVWTGSCPCQPFSNAGKRKGTKDERHLFPTWFNLIKACRPEHVFGEQVSSNDGLAWYDVVSSEMESTGYSIGAFDLCAASVGAPHIRQRLWFYANRLDNTFSERLQPQTKQRVTTTDQWQSDTHSASSRISNGFTQWQNVVYVPCADGKIRPIKPSIELLVDGNKSVMGRLRAYGNAINAEVAIYFIKAAMDVMP